MFENSGAKLKGVAIVVFVLEVIGALVTFIALMGDNEDLIFLWLLIAAAMVFAGWLSALFIYALGEAAESAQKAASYSYEALQIMKKQNADPANPTNGGYHAYPPYAPTGAPYPQQPQVPTNPNGTIPAWQRVNAQQNQQPRQW